MTSASKRVFPQVLSTQKHGPWLLSKMMSIVCVLAFIVGLLLLLVCLYAAYIHHVRAMYKHIPGPKADSFFLGHIPQIRRMHRLGVYTHHLFLNWAEEYGPVYKVFMLHKVMLIPTSHVFLEEILTKKQYPKAHVVYSRLYHTCGQRFLGNGLVTNMDHEMWSKRRAAIDPAFHKKYMRSLMKQFNDIGDQWLDELVPLADASIMFSMAEQLYRVTLDVIGKVAFNMDIEAILDQDSLFPKSLNQILEGFSAQLKDPLLQLKPSRRQFVRDTQSAARYLREQAREHIHRRIEQINQGDHQNIPDDILMFMIKSAAENPSLSIEDLVDDFMTIFIAGQETTSNTLAFLLNEVGRRPEILHRMQEEIHSVLGNKTYVSYEDAAKLEYMHQVWKETLRLYPPAPGTARENPSDCVIDNVFIPKKSFITISFFVNHRLASNFENPTHFDPDRFASTQPTHTFSYMPFSLGARSCAGQQFAQIEAKVLLCKLLQRFHFKLDPEQSFEVQETTTLRPKGGTKLTLSLR